MRLLARDGTFGEVRSATNVPRLSFFCAFRKDGHLLLITLLLANMIGEARKSPLLSEQLADVSNFFSQ